MPNYLLLSDGTTTLDLEDNTNYKATETGERKEYVTVKRPRRGGGTGRTAILSRYDLVSVERTFEVICKGTDAATARAAYDAIQTLLDTAATYQVDGTG